MSAILSELYDDAATVTTSDTVADPNGPFAALLVSAAGTLKITTIRGGTVALVVVAGQYVRITTQRVWTTGTAATVIGLYASPYKKGTVG